MGDLSFELPLKPWEAALGAAMVVPTPAGSIEMRVSAASGVAARLRIEGRGLPSPVAGQAGGDLAGPAHDRMAASRQRSAP